MSLLLVESITFQPQLRVCLMDVKKCSNNLGIIKYTCGVVYHKSKFPKYKLWDIWTNTCMKLWKYPIFFTFWMCMSFASPILADWFLMYTQPFGLQLYCFHCWIIDPWFARQTIWRGNIGIWLATWLPTSQRKYCRSVVMLGSQIQYCWDKRYCRYCSLCLYQTWVN